MLDNRDSRGRLTRRTVFWSGAVAILVSLATANASQVLHIHSKSVDGRYDVLAYTLDLIALIAFVAGWIVIVGCHWFPDPRRFRPLDLDRDRPDHER